jgi:hypothetical protein
MTFQVKKVEDRHKLLGHKLLANGLGRSTPLAASCRFGERSVFNDLENRS